MKISIVIPTYNRLEQIAEVLDKIFASDADGFEDVEVIVVDDGSKIPARDIVEAMRAQEPFRLKYIYQENAGPAEARNRGFRDAEHENVLFIDDDILVFPDLVRKHADAHAKYPGSVVFGQSPYPPMDDPTPAFRYLNLLADESLETVGALSKEECIKVEIVASGNLSVEKKLFRGRDVYSPGLMIPVGEEYELSAYLAKNSIPLLFFPEIKGWHLQPATITDSCNQNYKYGLGIAELAAKRPDVLTLEQPRHIFEANSEIKRDDRTLVKIKKSLRKIMSHAPVRNSILLIVKAVENILPLERILFPLYRLTVGNFFAAGIADGRKRYAGGSLNAQDVPRV